MLYYYYIYFHIKKILVNELQLLFMIVVKTLAAEVCANHRVVCSGYD